MTITNEMIEAAQLLREAAAVLTEVEAAGLDVKAVKNWRWPLLDELLGAAGILEAAEALRPKMVEVGEKTEEGTGMRHWNVEWATLAGMPIGTRLYAEK